MTIEQVKKYLKVDFSDDDDTIMLMIQAAMEYITAAVGKYEESSYRMRLILLALVSDMYENRTYTTDKQSEKTRQFIRNMLLQISLEEEG